MTDILPRCMRPWLTIRSQSAPWWYVAALAGVFTAVGALISVLGNLFNDRLKRKSDKINGVNDLTRQMCAEFVKATSVLHYLYSDSNPRLSRPNNDVVESAKEVEYQAYSVTQLVGDQSIFDKARLLHHATRTALDTALANGLKSDEVKSAGDEYRKCRREYLNSVRGFLDYSDIETN